MIRYYGFVQYGHRFEALVPTTVYEERAAVINVYKNNKKTSCDTFCLKEMPKWDIPTQSITLNKRDMNFLEKLMKSLLDEHKPDYLK